jgi:Protein of unknown function (DUF4235)
VSKILFIPFSLLGGVLAGIIGKKTFKGIWRVLDSGEAPDPKRHDVAWQKLIPALLLEGAIFRATRGLADHGARQVFSRLTGTWPGEKRSDAR